MKEIGLLMRCGIVQKDSTEPAVQPSIATVLSLSKAQGGYFPPMARLEGEPPTHRQWLFNSWKRQLPAPAQEVHPYAETTITRKAS